MPQDGADGNPDGINNPRLTDVEFIYALVRVEPKAHNTETLRFGVGVEEAAQFNLDRITRVFGCATIKAKGRRYGGKLRDSRRGSPVDWAEYSETQHNGGKKLMGHHLHRASPLLEKEYYIRRRRKGQAKKFGFLQSL